MVRGDVLKRHQSHFTGYTDGHLLTTYEDVYLGDDIVGTPGNQSFIVLLRIWSNVSNPHFSSTTFYSPTSSIDRSSPFSSKAHDARLSSSPSCLCCSSFLLDHPCTHPQIQSLAILGTMENGQEASSSSSSSLSSDFWPICSFHRHVSSHFFALDLRQIGPY